MRPKEMEKARCFEDLWIWQPAGIFVKETYTEFGPSTPGSKDFGFREQIRKAGISIMNNI